ncbi:MAG TPA: bifunctional DNA-formamidopyrimidine glycosylase/DNA-(apurinic or apyrimidinic site) lyase [Rhodospirillales bacterium]|nr:bifunctional DNA-formamidopyrimidine glycosylase/DNA-(apurinic or apyrimidinic site) lyase [Rhodospirillales bacterium]
MPELPEVETVRRGLAPVLEGRRFKRVIIKRAGLRFPFPKGFTGRLEGAKVVELKRRGKFLLAPMNSGETLIMHLGMSGRFSIFKDGVPPPEGPHDHVVFETDGGVTVRYWDPRRFGCMDLAVSSTLHTHPMLARLGPEPLSAEFDGPLLAALLKGRTTAVKTAIMDQSVIAGMGNIYASESLFRAGISPKRKAGNVFGRRAGRLARSIVDVLDEAIASGGSTLRDHRLPSGEAGYFQHRFAVYGRQGEACPGCDCDPGKTGGIGRIKQGGRATFYCARRQR